MLCENVVQITEQTESEMPAQMWTLIPLQTLSAMIPVTMNRLRGEETACLSRNQETGARKAASTAVQNWSANMDLTNMKNEFIKDLMTKKNI